ncbi:hypothetical protein EI983_17250 [Roseovarius faecimaris]|uniref:Uncharacterized protein n=1 Tax=Roseovarius faecimaris TaxID=2494550 RepID=A0A6I6IS66_9RHOB|nr:hypothetical protein [Roseovarius faecimaris]QGX99919.1 hypothetical protein EI983_17250 [Roseovarius faecimaris]
MLVLAYLASFAAGPATFWLLARRRTDRAGFARLAALALVLVVLALLLPHLAGTTLLAWSYFDLLLLVLLWLAWIVVLALCVQAVRPRLPNGSAHRWAFATGTAATTLPWFGLMIAQGMTR